MSFSPQEFLNSTMLAGFEAALKAAYERGREDAVTAIMAAAQLPMADIKPASRLVENRQPRQPQDDDSGDKAPRGTVPKVVEAMLADFPGQTVQDYEKLYVDYDPRVSDKSIGNELRRFEGRKYKRDRPGGYRWYLIDQTNEAPGTPTKDAPDAPSVSSNEGGPNGTALASE